MAEATWMVVVEWGTGGRQCLQGAWTVPELGFREHKPGTFQCLGLPQYCALQAEFGKGQEDQTDPALDDVGCCWVPTVQFPGGRRAF